MLLIASLLSMFSLTLALPAFPESLSDTTGLAQRDVESAVLDVAAAAANARFNCMVHLCDGKNWKGSCTAHTFLFKNRADERCSKFTR